MAAKSPLVGDNGASCSLATGGAGDGQHARDASIAILIASVMCCANLGKQVGVVNLDRARVEDADYSSETTAMAKAQILSQASTAMIAQANQSQQNVLSLLR
jgi:hypothetical protein